MTQSTTNLFRKSCLDLINAPEYSPRGFKTKELLNYSMVIENPRDRIILSKDRKISLPYLFAEWVWYMNGDPSVEDIKFQAPFWETIADENGLINSNYGTRIFGNHPYFPELNQFSNLIYTLINDINSRQAVLTINSPADIRDDNKDVPCTFSLQFLIREEKLNMIVNMRSNDAILGFGNDVFQFSMIQEMVYAFLKESYPFLQMGKYYHNAGSYHVYERHYDMISKIAKDETEYGWNGTNFNQTMPVETLSRDKKNLLGILQYMNENKVKQLSYSELFLLESFNELPLYWRNWVKTCWEKV